MNSGGMGGMDVGVARFTVSADTAAFRKALQESQQEAVQFAGATQTQMKGAAMTMMQVGQVADDLQYGFRAIVNNVQPIGMAAGQAFGMSTTAAMATSGAVGVLAVGVNMLVQHWGDMAEAMQSSWSDKPVEELHRIRKAAEDAAEAWAKLREQPTKLEAKSAKAVEQAIVEAPAAELHKSVEDALKQSPLFEAGGTPAEKAEIAQLRRQIEAARARVAKGDLTAPAALEDYEQALELQYNQMAGRLLGEAALPGKTGEQARLSLKTLIDRRPELFPKGVREALESAEPGAIQRQEDFEKQLKARKQVEKDIADEQKKRDREREKMLADQARAIRQRDQMKEEENRQADMLNNEGRANKAIGDKRAEDEQKEEDRLIDRLNRQGREIQKEGEREALKDQAEDLEQQMKRFKANLTPGQRQEAEARLLGATPQKAPQIFSSTQEFVKNTQLSALDQLGQQQLQHLKAMDTNLQQINQKIDDIGRLQ